MPLQLVVGLGNPGDEYRGTRHNAGADFVEALTRRHGANLAPNTKLAGRAGRLQGGGMNLHLLVPDTYMNESGRAVAAAVKFFKIDVADVLIAHDELDFAPGVARFKDGGGHGGHNGLRDVSRAVGDGYLRLRLGIGHPRDNIDANSHPGDVSGYVLRRPPSAEREQIDASIDAAIHALPRLAAGDLAGAMQRLHSAE